jgi:uncharacterized membrane protein
MQLPGKTACSPGESTMTGLTLKKMAQIGVLTTVLATSAIAQSLPAKAETAPEPGFYACNYTGEKIYTAISSLENNKWKTQGWYSIEPTKCRKLHNTLSNTRFYLRAQSDSGKVWGGNHNFCVDQVNGFLNTNSTADCPPLQAPAGFFSEWVPDMITGKMPSYYVHTFGPSTTNLNHPRA